MLSEKRIHRIKCQGYSGYSTTEISALAFGNRFAFILCAVLLCIGVALANIPILLTLMGLSFLAIVLSYHPFDYIYNNVLRGPLNKPRLPHRSPQLKFACSIAIGWIAVHIYFFYNGQMLAGYISGGTMLIVPMLASSIDFCIPSTIYNYLFKIKIE
ncbi:MAG: DUF4395 family protein [Crocinitomicaceae bacterium]|nr:DUF4395 family protein [Crocinitomicaceae bacterium]